MDKNFEPPHVAVLGAAAVDWVARVRELPPIDGIVYASEVQAMPGGSGGNIAEGIARLGLSVRFLGELGDDSGGQMLLKEFQNAGVDIQAVRIRQGQRSASCFITIDEHGNKTIVSLGGTAIYQTPEDIHPSWVNGVHVLVITDAFPEVATRAVSCLAPSAKVIFNPGGLMASYGYEFIEPILKETDVLITNRIEASALTGIAEAETALVELAKQGPAVVMVTLGQLGVLVMDHGERLQCEPFRVEDAVDTTGAGDAFTAGVVVGMLEQLNWKDAACLGCAVAGIKVRHPGARGGLPDRLQVQNYMNASDFGSITKEVAM